MRTTQTRLKPSQRGSLRDQSPGKSTGRKLMGCPHGPNRHGTGMASGVELSPPKASRAWCSLITSLAITPGHRRETDVGNLIMQLRSRKEIRCSESSCVVSLWEDYHLTRLTSGHEYLINEIGGASCTYVIGNDGKNSENTVLLPLEEQPPMPP